MPFPSQLSQARQGAYTPHLVFHGMQAQNCILPEKSPFSDPWHTENDVHLSTHACGQFTDGSTDPSVLKLAFLYTLCTQVRARPLSDTNPEISKYMEAVAGPSAGVGGIASLARRGRGDVDADSMGYDEVRYPEIQHGDTRSIFSPSSLNSSVGGPEELIRNDYHSQAICR